MDQIKKTIYFYGEDKIGGDVKVKQEFLVITVKSENIKNENVIIEEEKTERIKDKPASPADVKTELPEEEKSINTEEKRNDTEERGKKRSGGQEPKGNKSKKQKIAPKSGICLKIASGEECPFGERCKYSHDPTEFLASKGPDIAPECYVFSTFGFCPYGLSCRFGSAHIKDNKIVINDELLTNVGKPPVINLLKKESQQALRRGKREYPKSGPIIKKYSHNQNQNQNQTQTRTQNNNTSSESSSNTASSSSASVSAEQAVPPKITFEYPPQVDAEVPLKVSEKKQIDFKGKLYLAPLTTNGNLPYRRICKAFGVDITCGEMALASNLLKGQASEWALLRRHPSEDIFGVQVCGAFVDQMTSCAELIEQEDLDIDFVDINSGCPIDIIYNKGMGSALLDKPRRMEGIVRGMSEVLTRPLTIKLRIGKDDKSAVAHKIIPNLKLWGASAVTLHGRTRQQRYSKVADWDYIDTCAKASPIPLIGNGDIYNWQEAVHYMENTSISSIMIARAAIIKPWIFTEIKERRDWDISATERFDMLKKFSNYGLEHWGSDTQGVEKTRSFLLNWISFLCRYVPVGLLEKLPTRINERPPAFYGRSDLETLMGSKKVHDWINLSEMLLGPVAPSFSFEPKHKSNAYEDAQG